MDLSHWVSSIVAFLRAGYAGGVPATGHPLPGRRPSSDEITAITSELVMQRHRPISTVDVGVAITRVTDAMPTEDDIARVKRRLDAMGSARG
ncbi:DUF3349 domain-containing protein [Mycobacterium palustre]|uniref:DUF3349 domain-containing protein n=1 Tax=Mycobacterium palustre TaxID=153971 RepID=A0A1X1ZEI4_9MYCO|nr:DUF3349 domain-containing protein [Mycobacterium palustre]MCV7103091.1 DUF3349 domain-containing protein [Mycobacterium palustre]ORW21749.1 hypothetical protein AWC19_13795 [Mycobacterium palustre]